MVSKKSRKVPQLLSLLALALALSLPAQAQPSFQVEDLNFTEEQETLEAVYDQLMAPLGSALIYSVDDGLHGYELWKTDGTPGGEILLADICPGMCGSMPQALTPSGGRLFFFADDGEHGRELWVTDGTPEGTALVKDIRPGLRSGALQPWMFDADGTLYFPADDGLLGDELWKSDGTAAGTVLVKDIRPGAQGSLPIAHARSAGGLILLDADDGTHGREPWLTDGTAAGTSLLKDIRPGSQGSTFGQIQGREHQWLAMSNGLFLFVADDGTSYFELWASDGTTAGTVRLTDQDLLAAELPGWLTELGGFVYFAASTIAQGAELWRTDGTPAGTALFKDIWTGFPGSSPGEITVVSGRLFFSAQDTRGYEIWTSDGTPSGTVLVEDIRPGPDHSLPQGLDVVGGQLLFFVWQGPGAGYALWKSDGTEAGTSLLSEFDGGVPTLIMLIPHATAPAGGRLYFRVWDTHQEIDLWTSDGTADGTGLIAETISPTSSIWVSPRHGRVAEPSAWGALGSQLIYLANDGASGPDPWVSDGTALGTRLLLELAPGPAWSTYFGLTPLGNGKALFSDSSLWETDGTTMGTDRVFSGGPLAFQLTRAGSSAFFLSSELGGRQLWKTSGTAGGTAQIKLFTLGPWGNGPRELTVVGSTLFLSATESGTQNEELWRSDGMSAFRVKDIRPGLASSSPDHLTAVGTRLFFAADDGTSGREPWVSDGTEAGTFRLKDIVPGAGASIADISNPALEMPGSPVTAALATTFFFLADDGSGEELWASDGTEAGTRRVKDIRPGARGSEPRWLTVAGGRLFFTADDGTHGRELWMSDGTEAGTVLVVDLLPGAGSSLPRELLAVKSAVVFSATDGTHGIEPWATDGNWVRSLGDLAPDGLPSSPVRFTAAGHLIFFGANDGTTGFELWAFSQSALATPLDFYTVTPCRLADTRGGAPLRTDQPRSFPATGSCGIPADAKSVAVNLTVVAPNGHGYLTTWPTGLEKPATTSLNYSPGTVRSNNAILELGSGGQIEAVGQTGAANGQAHLVIDVMGYFR